MKECTDWLDAAQNSAMGVIAREMVSPEAEEAWKQVTRVAVNGSFLPDLAVHVPFGDVEIVRAQHPDMPRVPNIRFSFMIDPGEPCPSTVTQVMLESHAAQRAGQERTQPFVDEERWRAALKPWKNWEGYVLRTYGAPDKIFSEQLDQMRRQNALPYPYLMPLLMLQALEGTGELGDTKNERTPVTGSKIEKIASLALTCDITLSPPHYGNDRPAITERIINPAYGGVPLWDVDYKTMNALEEKVGYAIARLVRRPLENWEDNYRSHVVPVPPTGASQFREMIRGEQSPPWLLPQEELGVDFKSPAGHFVLDAVRNHITPVVQKLQQAEAPRYERVTALTSRNFAGPQDSNGNWNMLPGRDR